MAIVKLQAGNTTNVTAIKDFLDANKEDSFLEDMTITADASTPATPKLAISDGTNTFTLMLYNMTSFSTGSRTYSTFVIDGTTYTYASHNGASSGNASAQVNEIISGDNGLIIKLRIPYNYSSSAFVYGFVYILLSADSDGGLVVMYEKEDTDFVSGTVSTSYNKGFRLYAHNSTGTATANVTTNLNSLKTVLAPVQPMVSDVSTKVENVYISTQSQLQTVGLQAVTIETKDYITNGYWYVKG